MHLLSDHGSFGSVQRFYRHASQEIGLPMRFALFLPPSAVARSECPS
jgi:S-formylglutathione hydrolase